MTIYESCFLTLLNRNNETIGWVKISQGGVAGTTIDTKLVAKYAIDTLASAVILCHNHPSGTLKPSKSDIEITNQVKKSFRFIFNRFTGPCNTYRERILFICRRGNDVVI